MTILDIDSNGFIWLLERIGGFLIIPILIALFAGKKKVKDEKIGGANNLTKVDSKNQVPDVCPNCKSPNTNKSISCEWCGANF